MAFARRSRRAIDIWPGFVDALASLLMVFVFVLLIFMLAQFFLTDTLAGRNEALRQLTRGIHQLADTLSLEQRKSEELGDTVTRLDIQLKATLQERDAAVERAQALQEALREAQGRIAADRERIELQLRDLAGLQQDIAALREVRASLEAEVGRLESAVRGREESLAMLRDRSKALEARLAEEGERTRLAQAEVAAREIRLRELTARITATDEALAHQERLSAESSAQVALLNQQVHALREQLAGLAKALAASEATVSAQKVEIADLGQRLNLALAKKVEELSRYRSEFFGRLREVLGDHPDIRVVGDRFLFQAELLFPSGSAQLGEPGKRQLARLAETLKSVAARIPRDIDWVLQVDGHTDRRPINTSQYPSNWELSLARALSIVRYLIEQGVPPQRLAAAGFGEFHPIDGGDSEAAYSRNRRIEIKLTDL